MLAMVGCATNSAVTPLSGATTQQQARTVPSGPDWHYAGGVLYHTPHIMVTRQMARAQVQPNILLNYGNGPVLVAPKTYVIFWGYKTYGDPDKVKKLLKTYTKHMGGSGHNNIYTQYFEKSGGSTIYITNPSNQVGQWLTFR